MLYNFRCHFHIPLSSGSDGKESACNAGDLGSVLGLWRSPGGGHGKPLQYSCLEKPRGRRSPECYCPWGHKELYTLSDQVHTATPRQTTPAQLLRWPSVQCVFNSCLVIALLQYPQMFCSQSLQSAPWFCPPCHCLWKVLFFPLAFFR